MPGANSASVLLVAIRVEEPSPKKEKGPDPVTAGAGGNEGALLAAHLLVRPRLRHQMRPLCQSPHLPEISAVFLLPMAGSAPLDVGLLRETHLLVLSDQGGGGKNIFDASC